MNFLNKLKVEANEGEHDSYAERLNNEYKIFNENVNKILNEKSSNNQKGKYKSIVLIL